MTEQSLLELALTAGAARAAVLTQDQIVLSETFRDICRANQCGSFGRCWMCPPFLGPVRELMDKVRSYPQALWYQSVSPVEDSFDIEGMFAAAREHALLSQRIQGQLSVLLKKPWLHLSCGGCHLCPVCAKVTGEPCRKPDRALPSLEGYGIDVYRTTITTDLPYINGKNTVTYFGMILFTE